MLIFENKNPDEFKKQNKNTLIFENENPEAFKTADKTQVNQIAPQKDPKNTNTGNFAEWAGAVNRAGEYWADKLNAPKVANFFRENQEYLGNRGTSNESFLGQGLNSYAKNVLEYTKAAKKPFGADTKAETELLKQADANKAGHETKGLIADMIFDPANIIPLGAAAKIKQGMSAAQKAKTIGKEAAKWGAFTGGLSATKDYANDKSGKEIAQNAAISALMGGTLGGAMASGIPQKILSKAGEIIKTPFKKAQPQETAYAKALKNENLKTQNAPLNTSETAKALNDEILKNPEAYGLKTDIQNMAKKDIAPANEAPLNETAPLNEPKPFRLDPYEVEALKPKRNESIYEIDDEITKALKKGIDQNRAPQIKEQPEMPKIELSDETVRNLKPKPESDFSDYLANLNRANKNEFVGGNSARNNFVMKSDGKITYPYNAFLDIENELADKLKLPKEQIRASLTYLYNNHPEMFDSKGDVYRTLKSLRDIHDYAGDSFKNPDVAYMASKLNDKKMNDVAISRDSGGTIHLNRNRDIRGIDRQMFKSAVGAGNSQHRQLVSVPQMNTSKEHFSPTYASIIPQNTKDLSKNPLLSFIKPEKKPDISQNPFLNITNKSLQKEQRGIYNVAYNDKKSTIIHKDFDAIDDAIKLERGKADYISKNGTKKSGFGILHMQKHFDPTKNGYVKPQEVMKMGEIVRNVKPIIKDNKRVYEYFDNEGTRFRVIVGDKKNGERIISFFSDRKGGLANDKPTYIYSPLNDNIISQKPVNNNMKKAFATPAIAGNIVGAGAGAVTGALNSSDENRLDNMILGAIGGMALVNGAPKAVNAIKNHIKSGDNVNKLAKTLELEAKIKKGDGIKYANEIVANHVNAEFKDISRDLSGDIKSIFHNTKNFFRENFTETKGAAYTLKKDEMSGAISAYSGKVSKLQKALTMLDESDRTAIHNYLSGEAEALKTPLKNELKPLADSIRENIDAMSDELVKNGVISKEVSDSLKGEYLMRGYKKDFKDSVKDFFGGKIKIDEIYERGRAVETISKKEFENRIKTDKNFQNLLNTPYNKGGIRAQEKGDKIELWKDYTPSERETMGEIRDSAISVPRTLARMKELTEHAKFLNEIGKLDESAILDSAKTAKEFGVKSIKELDENARKELSMRGFEKVPNDAKYGVLADRYIRRDILNDIKQIHISLFGRETGIGRAWQNYLNAWKKAKTIYNLPAHINNFVSNGFLMQLAGVSGVKVPFKMINSLKTVRKGARFDELDIKAMAKRANADEIKELNALKNDKDLQILFQARDAGLFGRSQLADITNGEIKSINESGNVFMKGANKAAKIAENFYEGEDNVGRLALFSHYLEKGYNAKEAKTITNMWIPDYTRGLPKGLQILRDTGISPFISWTYYTIPTMMKYIRLHPAEAGKRILPVLGALEALQYGFSGISNPYDDKIPDDIKGRSLIINKSGDKMTTVKLDRYIPYFGLLEPANFATGLVSGVSTNLANDALTTMSGETRQLYNGRPVTMKNKSAGEKAIDYAKYFTSNYVPLPQQFYNAEKLAEAQLRDEKKRKTNNVWLPKSKKQSWLQFLGFNTNSYSKRALQKERIEKRR